MIENSIKISPKSLRPHKRLDRNTDFLLKAKNVEASRFGLTPYEPVDHLDWDYLNAFGIEWEWPFPIIFRGKGNTFLLSGDRLFLVTEEDWTIVEQDLYDYTAGTITTATKGHAWQFVDFWDTYMFNNGLCTIWHANLHSITGNADRVYVEKDVRVNAGCAFRGRTMLGGFDPDHNYSADWNTFVNAWVNVRRSDPNTIYDLDFQKNFVWWSSIGGGDALMLFERSLATDGPYGIDEYHEASKPLIWDTIRKNEMGWMPMPFQGPIVEMKVIGGDVVVYGEDGIAFMRPHSHLFGLMEGGDFSDIGQMGVHNAGAVGGNDKVQLVVTGEGSLWLIEAGLKVTNLGYEDFLKDMVGTDIIVSYVPKAHGSSVGKFHISNGLESLLFTPDGLTTVTQHVTSKVYVAGEVVGVAISAAEVDRGVEIETSTVSISNERAMRHIGWVEMESVSLPFEQVQARLYYRVAGKVYPNDSWDSTNWQNLNFKGATYFGITGLEFKIAFKVGDFDNVTFGDFIVRYQTPDRTTKRGTSPVGVGAAI